MYGYLSVSSQSRVCSVCSREGVTPMITIRAVDTSRSVKCFSASVSPIYNVAAGTFTHSGCRYKPMLILTQNSDQGTLVCFVDPIHWPCHGIGKGTTYMLVQGFDWGSIQGMCLLVCCCVPIFCWFELSFHPSVYARLIVCRLRHQ